jgi:NADPH:quinone reductase
MRALLLTAYDGPGALRLADVPEPESSGLVAIEVYAAGVGYPDLLITQGRYQVKPEIPFVPGLEVAGLVRSAPPGSAFRAGDQVAAAVAMGGFAELAVARPERVMPIPSGLGFAGATALPVNYVAAYLALVRRAHMIPGEIVLVHGAGGGTGSAAVEVAKWLGATVIATAGSPERCEVASRAGADHVLRSDGDWRTEVLELLGGPRVAVVFDPVGGDRVALDSIRVLAPEGRWLVIGFTSGQIPAVPVNRYLLRNVSAVGVHVSGFVASEPGLVTAAAAALGQMHADGRLHPSIRTGYRLDDGPRALAELATRAGWGKAVLTVRP